MAEISIIIPARNEADFLPATLAALKRKAVTSAVKEVIVVDGGSQDNTAAVAREAGAEVVLCPPAQRGRARQLNLGAERSRGDILLFLDADSIVPAGFDAEILTALRMPQCVGGAFEFKLEGNEFGLRVVEFINRSRYRLWPWYYGDQGIFVARDAFRQAGGYPPVALMEASDFCRALGRNGKMVLIHLDMVTSSRRFREGGIYRVLGFDIHMWWRNLTGQDVEQFARAYWDTHQPKEGAPPA